jgi:hypothetical protein
MKKKKYRYMLRTVDITNAAARGTDYFEVGYGWVLFDVKPMPGNRVLVILETVIK